MRSNTKKRLDKFSAIIILLAMVISFTVPSFAGEVAESDDTVVIADDASDAGEVIAAETLATDENTDASADSKAEEAVSENSEADTAVSDVVSEDPSEDDTVEDPVSESEEAEEAAHAEETAETGSVEEVVTASEEEQASEPEEESVEEEVVLAAPKVLLAAPMLGASPTTATVGDYEITGSSEDYNYDKENNVLYVYGNVTIKNADPSLPSSTSIVTKGDCAITLAGVNIKPEGGPGILVQAKDTEDKDANTNVEIVLADGTDNTVLGASGTWINHISGDYAAIEVEFIYESGENPSNTMASLTISGSGSLTATGSSNAAGIGGSNSPGGSRGHGLYGNITINSGKITATSPDSGAGIGSSNNPGDGTSTGSYKKTGYNTWGTITINNGDITARSGNRGAGIGGGNHVDSGKIVINGGTVAAEGEAGIGTGIGSSNPDGYAVGDKGPGTYCADVTINGGTINAKANSDMGAGIGGGMYSDAYVTINGGEITASVNADKGNAYQGGAGIGGGYQGCAVVTITGGTIHSTGGHGAPGIGNGAGASVMTYKKYENGEWTGVKKIRTGTPTIKGEESIVKITGGNVKAFGGLYGAGIGTGNFSQWCNVEISGGTVYSVGSPSSDDEMLGGAGIGSGTRLAPSKMAYKVETDVNISITGGEVIAIGGWGASGIGSGAENKMADTITIDATKADLQAYSDGTKFAIDTRSVSEADENGLTTTTSVKEGRTITGDILQGTFVHTYKERSSDGEGLRQGTEGLSSIVITHDDDPSSEPKELTLMPTGYRSYATDVEAPGNYTVYSDAEEVGAGQGRYFSICQTEQRFVTLEDGSIIDTKMNEEGVKYVVKTGELSDNFYLFPVKTISVEKIIDMPEEDKDGFNTTVYFALHNGNGFLNINGGTLIESIEIKDGIPQGKAFFVDIPDETYDVWEVVGPDDTSPLETGMTFGSAVLKSIETQHGDDMEISSSQQQNGFMISSAEADGGNITITAALSDDAMIHSHQTFTLQLYGDGHKVGERVRISESSLSAEWTVPKNNEDGSAIKYILKEVSNNTAVSDSQLSDELKITNTYEVQKEVEISLLKVMNAYYDSGENANATLVFKVYVPDPDDSAKELYSNYYAFTFTEAGAQDMSIVVPVTGDMKSIVIEEVYTAGYKAKEAKQTIDLADVDVTQPIEVVFENTFNEETILTGGIINRYSGGKIFVDRPQ